MWKSINYQLELIIKVSFTVWVGVARSIFFLQFETFLLLCDGQIVVQVLSGDLNILFWTLVIYVEVKLFVNVRILIQILDWKF